jgi:hypothetical protein
MKDSRRPVFVILAISALALHSFSAQAADTGQELEKSSVLTSPFLLHLATIPLGVSLEAAPGDIPPDSKVQVGQVTLPRLSRSQWKMLRQQQGANPQPLHVDIHLAVNHGLVYAVRIRPGHGTGDTDVDNTIVRWIRAYWKTDTWFVGGDSYMVSMIVEPALRRIVFANAT